MDADSGSLAAAPKFPHTRAELVTIARQYKPLDYEDDADVDPLGKIDPTLLSSAVSLLDAENDDGVKRLLIHTFSMEEDEADEHVLNLMHKHRDDVAGVPFLFLTTARRPISRPSSRASTHSNLSARLAPARPDTPNSAPSSPLANGFRRPHTPATSPLAYGAQGSSYMNAYMSTYEPSPSSSPVLAHAIATHAHAQFAASLPASPMSSPRILSAKASEFKPIPRPLTRTHSNPGSLSALRAQTPSPDLWAHDSPKASSLAIARPLVPDMPASRSVTPSSSLRSSVFLHHDDDEEDPFDPFNARAGPLAFQPTDLAEFDAGWIGSASSDSDPALSADDRLLMFGSPDQHVGDGEDDAEAQAVLTGGMTPFDVLSSVFGTTLAPSELEDALANSGYDFERAMASLIDRALPAQSPKPAAFRGAYNVRGARMEVRPAPRYMNTGRPAQGGNRVCRYFLAGECLRADCRFSHDLERAMCRFWLRGTCAKGENCEFLHHLPPEVDVSRLATAMSHADLGAQPRGVAAAAALDEFPALGSDSGSKRSNEAYDPSRTRFAAAVKRVAPATGHRTTPSQEKATLVARRQAMGSNADPLHHHTAIVAPRASPRIRLRPPRLLPTLPTGEAVNKLYGAYRGRALQLGAARNACLSRAADAWRRGDGAAAKRFSREGHELNAKMGSEMGEAARRLVGERAKIVQEVVRAREAGWSDDPGDRTAKGKACGAGLGVCLGISSREMSGEGAKYTPEERTESMMDLHGLHANEATEVLEDFLLALEKEHFYGLAYLVVGEEKHTGTQDPARGASRVRLAAGVREWLHRWGYPWSEAQGVICVDPLTHE